MSEADSHYLTSYVHGVCTLEISACEVSDSATYRCAATNPLGNDETTCLLHVEEIYRTRRAHSTIRDRSRSPSVNLLSTSSKDTTSWRDKLGANERPAPRDTLDVEKPSEKQQ